MGLAVGCQRLPFVATAAQILGQSWVASNGPLRLAEPTGGQPYGPVLRPTLHTHTRARNRRPFFSAASFTPNPSYQEVCSWPQVHGAISASLTFVPIG
jgi:hypothetical protein